MTILSRSDIYPHHPSGAWCVGRQPGKRQQPNEIGERRVAEMAKLFEDNGPRAGQGKVSDAIADARQRCCVWCAKADHARRAGV